MQSFSAKQVCQWMMIIIAYSEGHNGSRACTVDREDGLEKTSLSNNFSHRGLGMSPGRRFDNRCWRRTGFLDFKIQKSYSVRRYFWINVYFGGFLLVSIDFYGFL